MRARVEPESAGAAEDLRGWVDALEVLPLVLGRAGFLEPAHVRVPTKDAREQARPAPVEAADEDQAVLPVDHEAVS